MAAPSQVQQSVDIGSVLLRFVRSITDSRGRSLLCFHACGRLLAIALVANTYRLRTCASSPKQTPDANRREGESNRANRSSRTREFGRLH
jgi:hypothetical protein